MPLRIHNRYRYKPAPASLDETGSAASAWVPALTREDDETSALTAFGLATARGT